MPILLFYESLLEMLPYSSYLDSFDSLKHLYRVKVRSLRCTRQALEATLCSPTVISFLRMPNASSHYVVKQLGGDGQYVVW